jgi:hypothetical protein
MTTMPSFHRLAGLLLLALLPILACGDDGPTEVAPVPGTLSLHLTTPHPDDHAILIRLEGPGPIQNVEAYDTRWQAFSRDSGSAVSTAIFGPLSSGIILEFAVPDVNRSAQYSATIVEVASADHRLRISLSGYQAAITR